MAVTPVTKALYPNVPLMAGVPPLLRSAGASGVVSVVLAIALDRLIRRLSAGQKWGLYNSKGQLFEADSIVEVGYQQESRISDFPVIDGSFASYNKVRLPYMPTLRISKGGSIQARQAFLDAIEAAANSLELFSIVTPERTYINVNIEMVGYSRRASESVSLLIVDVKLREIRQTQPAYTTVKPVTQPKQPAATSQVNSGQVQTKPVANQSMLDVLINGKAGQK